MGERGDIEEGKGLRKRRHWRIYACFKYDVHGRVVKDESVAY
jgi:hypothetical protein